MKNLVWISVLGFFALTTGCASAITAHALRETNELGYEPGLAPRSTQEASPEAPSTQETRAAEVAKELADPVNALGKLALNFDFIDYGGDLPGSSSQTSTVMTFQPSLPYPLENGDRIFARPAIPIIFDQPVFNGSNFESEGVEIGDIGYDLSYGGSLGKSGWIYLLGIAGTLPTATKTGLGKDQWAAGPEALLGKLGDWGAIGVLLSHQWDFASTSSSASDVSLTGGQYFYTYLLDDGWAIGAAPTFAYDWEASSGNEFTFPLATGVSKTVVFGKTPWRFGIEAWWFVDQADAFGPEWQLRLNVTPVVPLPW